MNRYQPLLRNAGFRAIWLAAVISGLGDRIAHCASQVSGAERPTHGAIGVDAAIAVDEHLRHQRARIVGRRHDRTVGAGVADGSRFTRSPSESEPMVVRRRVWGTTSNRTASIRSPSVSTRRTRPGWRRPVKKR